MAGENTHIQNLQANLLHNHEAAPITDNRTCAGNDAEGLQLLQAQSGSVRTGPNEDHSQTEEEKEAMPLHFLQLARAHACAVKSLHLPENGEPTGWTPRLSTKARGAPKVYDDSNPEPKNRQRLDVPSHDHDVSYMASKLY